MGEIKAEPLTPDQNLPSPISEPMELQDEQRGRKRKSPASPNVKASRVKLEQGRVVTKDEMASMSAEELEEYAQQLEGANLTTSEKNEIRRHLRLIKVRLLPAPIPLIPLRTASLPRRHVSAKSPILRSWSAKLMPSRPRTLGFVMAFLHSTLRTFSSRPRWMSSTSLSVLLVLERFWPTELLSSASSPQSPSLPRRPQPLPPLRPARATASTTARPE